MAAKQPVGVEPAPKYRFTYSGDQNKYGRIIAMLLTQYASKDTRGSAQVRFDVYPSVSEQRSLGGSKYLNCPVYTSRIYVQRDIDKDDKLPGRPYLLVEEILAKDLIEGLDISEIVVFKVEMDAKGRPQRHAPRSVIFQELPDVAQDAYEFLVGM